MTGAEESLLTDDFRVARVGYASVASRISLTRPTPSTRWQWALAASPLVGLIGALAAVGVQGYVEVGQLALLLMLTVAVSFALSFADARELRIRGVRDATPAIWGLVPAVYLWRRYTPFDDQHVSRGSFWLHVVGTPMATAFALAWANIGAYVS